MAGISAAIATFAFETDDVVFWIATRVVVPGFLASLSLYPLSEEKRTLRWVDAFRNELVDGGTGSPTGIVLVLHDGLIVQMIHGAISFWLLGSMDGTVLRPHLARLLEWTQPGRLTAVRLVDSNNGSEAARAKLDVVRRTLQVDQAALVLYRAGKSSNHAEDPAWTVVATFANFSGVHWPNAGPFISGLESNRTWLRESLGNLSSEVQAM